MPNEAVQCPSCGSSNVHQLVADSYECEHCDTEFRWVYPTAKAIVHELRICKCGNNAVAICVRCHEPVCKRCKYDWVEEPSEVGFDDLGSAFVELYGERKTRPELSRVVKNDFHLPEDGKFVLCKKCDSEYYKALEKVIVELKAKEEVPIPASLPLIKTRQEPSFLVRLWDWLRGFGK